MSNEPQRVAVESPAAVFAALGDPCRAKLVRRLGDGRPRSLVQLARGHELSRQAIRKHLSVLERAGLVSAKANGRESHFTLVPDSLAPARTYLDRVAQQWDEALERLRYLVES